jgi:hypothetical protein
MTGAMPLTSRRAARAVHTKDALTDSHQSVLGLSPVGVSFLLDLLLAFGLNLRRC